MKRLICILLLAPALFGQSVEERLAKLEQEVRELRAENAELRKQLPPAPPLVAPAAPPKAAAPDVKPVGKESKLQLGGFLQVQAESGDRVDTRFADENDRVFLRRARFAVQGSFPEDFDFKAELEAGGGLGTASGVRAQAADAYIQWSRHKFAQIRAGQFKTPYGYEQIFSDTKTLTVERTLASDRIALGRGLGVQLQGDAGALSYAVGAFNGNGTNLTFNDDEGFLTVARVSMTPWKRGDSDRWSVGVNGFTGEDHAAPVAPELGFTGNTFAGSRDAWGVDTQLIAGKLELWGELLRAEYTPTAGPSRDLTGWYAASGWMLTKKLQAVAMLDRLDAPSGDIRTITLGGNYFIKGHDLKLQLNVMRSNTERTRVTARLQTLF